MRLPSPANDTIPDRSRGREKKDIPHSHRPTDIVEPPVYPPTDLPGYPHAV